MASTRIINALFLCFWQINAELCIFSKERHHCSVMSEYFRWYSTNHISIERTEHSNKIATIIYALKLCHINKYIKPNRNPQLNSFARCWIMTGEREREYSTGHSLLTILWLHLFRIFVSNHCNTAKFFLSKDTWSVATFQ